MRTWFDSTSAHHNLTTIMEQTLLLNATFEPLDVLHWQRAMVLWAQGKVEIVETHDREVRSVTFSFKLPSVVRLLKYVRTRRRPQVQFTRANIYTRDNYTCQYCRKEFPTQDLTFDHVVPASKGGTRSWDNIVTCCLNCNRKKANQTPEEAGMTLMRKPIRPAYTPVFRVTLGIRRTPESWRSFLYWNAELDEE
jgi:5-methylcytosine-specific restriction endonuclease McrA